MSRPRYLTAALIDRGMAVPALARLRERLIAARMPEAELGSDGLPLPPARLRVLVTGGEDPEEFISAGARQAGMIREAAGGIEGSVLDFGCGCGRIARHWAGLGLDLNGCDYNPEPVRWCREHLPFIEARVNSLEPPTPYPDDRFDLVYAISVLTHLTEELAHAWLAEWRRVLKPGGTLLFTTHGDALRETLTKKNRALYDAGEVVIWHPRAAGRNACSVHHPQSYVTEQLLAKFELVTFRPGDHEFEQDVYVATPAG